MVYVSDVDSHRFVYDRFVFNRKLLVFAHVLAGVISAFWYLSHVDLSHFGYWRRNAAFPLLIIAGPAIVPYVVSGVYSWRVVTDRRLGVWVYLVILVVGSVLVDILFSGVWNTNKTRMLEAAGVQMCIYLWAAEMLLHIV